MFIDFLGIVGKVIELTKPIVRQIGSGLGGMAWDLEKNFFFLALGEVRIRERLIDESNIIRAYDSYNVLYFTNFVILVKIYSIIY